MIKFAVEVQYGLPPSDLSGNIWINSTDPNTASQIEYDPSLAVFFQKVLMLAHGLYGGLDPITTPLDLHAALVELSGTASLTFTVAEGGEMLQTEASQPPVGAVN